MAETIYHEFLVRLPVITDESDPCPHCTSEELYDEEPDLTLRFDLIGWRVYSCQACGGWVVGKQP
jgi:hypothetical protein